VTNDISAPDIERLPLLSKQEAANILLDRIRDSLKK
jgi:hypothetical protein